MVYIYLVSRFHTGLSSIPVLVVPVLVVAAAAAVVVVVVVVVVFDSICLFLFTVLHCIIIMIKK